VKGRSSSIAILVLTVLSLWINVHVCVSIVGEAVKNSEYCASRISSHFSFLSPADFRFSQQDTNPPTIMANITVEPKKPDSEENVTVTVSVIDNESGVKEASLYYSTNQSEGWSQLLMIKEDSTYKAIIPKQPYRAIVSYYIEALDNSNNKAKSEISTYRVTIYVPEVWVYLIGFALVALLVLLVIGWIGVKAQELVKKEENEKKRKEQAEKLYREVQEAQKRKQLELEERRRLERIELEKRRRFSKLDNLSPREFEELVGELFKRMGFQVELGPYVKDFGADIIARKGENTYLVQVKKYANQPVGAQIVQQALGSTYKHSANRVILITTSYFTLEAKEQARKAPIELWEREDLRKMIEQYMPELVR